METIEKVAKCLVVNEETQSVVLSKVDEFFGNDSDVEVIREKVVKFNRMISKMSKIRFQKFLNMDWESQIYPML